MKFLFGFIITIHPLITLSHFPLHFTSMHLEDFFHSSLVISLFISILSHGFPKYACGVNFRYAACNSSVECGRLGKIHYPFWVNGSQPWYCGHLSFGLDCVKDEATIFIWPEKFHVLELDNRNQTLKIARINESSTGNIACPYPNSSMNSTSFSYTSDVEMIRVLHNCPLIKDLSSYEYPCKGNNKKSHSYFVANTSLANRFSSRCGYSAHLPVLGSAAEGLMNGSLDVGEALSKGFEVKWTANEEQCKECMESGGRCGYDWNLNRPSCFCRDQPYLESCKRPQSKPESTRRKVAIAIAIAGGGILFACFLIICCCLRKRSDGDAKIEAFVKNYGSLAPKRYSYSDVKKMTDSFRNKLGQGGFGSVYRGMLPDGRLVAVKLLDTSKETGEGFINEVASISRTSHVNIVSLWGFCYESGKRALIYEFMCNGSLEKFIYGEDPLRFWRHLAWEKLYQIAIGIARGLEYLHCRCNTQILHFDVKPHNILLDDDFCPKISDFGLAKLCHREDGVVSMRDARGTMGYVAPEVFNRNYGEVSSKSDVYSYGMMSLEMVGGRKNINAAVSHTSKIYFPHWVYKRLELAEDLGLQGIVNKEENEIARKMIVVGLWCIQINPSHRPSMSKVIEMLEGSIEALQIPPKPFLSSPSRSPADSSISAPMDI